MGKIINHIFEEIISVENLLQAWTEFVRGKSKRSDVKIFSRNLLQNILDLHEDLTNLNYKHANYEKLNIADPKPRIIHKATVRDRVLHRAIYRVLYPLFDKTFIFDSYSCRNGKGTHRAFKRLAEFSEDIRRNNSPACQALKCDIKKFFHNVDHDILIGLLTKKIADSRAMILLVAIIKSFETSPGKGLPLGNLTSQLFANIYLDPLDKFIKHQMKIKFYLRYADDFILLSKNRQELLKYLRQIERFVNKELKLKIHPDKIQIRKLNWGIDFVGYVNYPQFNLPRRATLKRILVRLEEVNGQTGKINGTFQSYLGYLSHVNAYKISEVIRNKFNYCRHRSQPSVG